MSDPMHTRATLLVSSDLEHNALVHACAAVRDREERTQDDQLGDGRHPDPAFDLQASDRRIAESWMLADQLDSDGTVGVPLGIADEIVGYLASVTTNELKEILGYPGTAPIGVHIEGRVSLMGLLGSLTRAINREPLPA